MQEHGLYCSARLWAGGYARGWRGWRQPTETPQGTGGIRPVHHSEPGPDSQLRANGGEMRRRSRPALWSRWSTRSLANGSSRSSRCNGRRRVPSLQVRTQVLDKRLEETFRGWYPPNERKWAVGPNWRSGFTPSFFLCGPAVLPGAFPPPSPVGEVRDSRPADRLLALAAQGSSPAAVEFWRVRCGCLRLPAGSA